ncbi:CRISPR-associated primase-polymerase type A1 [Dehalococcoidia bacterium]|nr:CRISPR-associated primase-polymerase type A1 [Dehalococcoidia bacterium]
MDEDVYASIERLRKLIHCCPELPQAYRDLASCYAEIGEYGLAQESSRKALELEAELTPEEKPPLQVPLPVELPQIAFSEEDVLLFASLFKGKEGFFARQWIDERGRRGFHPEAGSLSLKEIKNYFDGEKTLGLYLITEQDQVHLSVVDIDISQKALLEYTRDEKRLEELHWLTHQDARKIASVCDDLGVPVIIEDSGYKGRHLWFFFSSPIPARLARTLLRFITQRAGKPGGGIHWEIFPNCDKVKGKGFGPLIKLPLGIHRRTNRRCLFLNREGHPLADQMSVLSEINPIPQQKIEEILLTYTVKPQAAPLKKEGEPSLVKNLLSGCKVINYLVEKAKETHYLDNAERVTLLYTLGHLGDDGKTFLHKVISNCVNYDYEFTEKRIKKLKSYPISCGRIREKHEDFALDLGCDCTFKLPRKGYPSPILHAFSQPKTWPLSRLPGENESAPAGWAKGISTDEINGKLRRYIELKKQLVGVEKSISRVEEEMTAYFDQLATDNVETDYGILVRRKSGDKFDWIIRL